MGLIFVGMLAHENWSPTIISAFMVSEDGCSSSELDHEGMEFMAVARILKTVVRYVPYDEGDVTKVTTSLSLHSLQALSMR